MTMCDVSIDTVYILLLWSMHPLHPLEGGGRGQRGGGRGKAAQQLGRYLLLVQWYGHAAVPIGAAHTMTMQC